MEKGQSILWAQRKETPSEINLHGWYSDLIIDISGVDKHKQNNSSVDFKPYHSSYIRMLSATSKQKNFAYLQIHVGRGRHLDFTSERPKYLLDYFGKEKEKKEA